MGTDEQPYETTDIQVGTPETRDADPIDAGTGGSASTARRVIDKPAAMILKVRTRYKHLNRKDKSAVLLAVFAIVMVIVIMSIWSTGGGIGGPDLVPEIRPPSDWNLEALDLVELTGDEENTNLEGQETPYLVPLRPATGEIYFLMDLECHVEWVDESTPPTNVPAIGYENQPDGFYLIVRIHDDVGEWRSELVFNSIGSSQSIDLSVSIGEYLGRPVAVANKEGADYLPQGYLENVRVDFIVVTEECGDWTPSDPFRPTVGDGGNHFTFTWSVQYRLADSTKEP